MLARFVSAREPGLREKTAAALTDMLGETEGEVAAVDGSSS